MKDWHSILGVAKNSTIEEIAKAYRKKALEFHPDRNPAPNAAALFKEINTAYMTLTDPSYKPVKPRPAPKRKTVWDVEESTFKDSMEGHYEHQKSRNYYAPQRYAPTPKEKEVDLWENHVDQMQAYWKEYNRLKEETAYEDPELFWQKLDEWNRKQKKN